MQKGGVLGVLWAHAMCAWVPQVGLFKGKAGAGMGDDILVALHKILDSRRLVGIPEYPLYVPAPPAAARMPSLTDLRRKYRDRLAPRAASCDAPARWLPAPFDVEITGDGRGHVLEVMKPLAPLVATVHTDPYSSRSAVWAHICPAVCTLLTYVLRI